MGLLEPIKGIYYFFEDKWYNFLDALAKKIPVYKIIDPIDRVIPSFLLLIFILIILILGGLYFANFSESMRYNFSVVDSKTKLGISGVTLLGQINGIEFDTSTDEFGNATAYASNSFSLRDIAEGILFGSKKELYGNVKAKKEGYSDFSAQLPSGAREIQIELEKLKVTQPQKDTGQLEGIYSDTATITLIDSETKRVILDSTGEAHVTFRCANKTINPITAFDSDDGEVDGKFTLNANNCWFSVTEAAANGYEEASGMPLTLSKDRSEYIIELQKIITSSGKGKIKIFVSEKNSLPKKMIPLVQVTAINSAGNSAGIGFTDNSGVAIISDLDQGRYKLTAMSPDGNYASVGIDANIGATVVLGTTAEAVITMEKIIPENKRMLKFRIEDWSAGTVVIGAKAYAQKILVTSSGKEVAGEATVSCVNSCVSDSNGIITIKGLTTADEGSIVVSISRAGYLTKIIQPRMMKLDESPLSIQLENAAIGGSAKIIVRNSAQNVLLAGASAYLYVDSSELAVKKIRVVKEGILTDANGTAVFLGLPAGQSYKYYAKASMHTATSDLTNPQTIASAGSQITFNIGLNLNVATIQLQLLDYSGTAISASTAQGAIVSLYETSEDRKSILSQTALETLQYNSQSGLFNSSAYETSKKLVLFVTLDGYSPSFVEIPILISGENQFKAYLYPVSLLDKNVKAFFNGIYSTAEDAIRGNRAQSLSLSNSSVSNNLEYYLRTDTVIRNDLNYLDLFGMISLSDIASIESVPFVTNLSFAEKGRYSCLPAQKFPINDDNYYLQADAGCIITDANSPGRAAGARWSGGIRRGTYSIISKFKFSQSAADGNVLSIHFAGKESDSLGSAEDMNDINFTIGQVIINPGQDPADYQPKISFIISLNTKPTNSDNFSYANDTKRFTDANDTLFPIFTSNQINTMRVSLRNNTLRALTIKSLSVYPYSGIKESFIPSCASSTSIRFGAAAGGANCYSNSALSAQDANIAASTVSRTSVSNVQAVNFTQSAPNATSYLVVVAELTDGNIYTLFIDTKSDGAGLIISGARFFMGVPNQTFDGEVYSRDGMTKVGMIENGAVLTVKTNNCTTVTERPAAAISGTPPNYFKATIEGTYSSTTDCVVVTIIPSDPAYTALTKTFYAGTGTLQDATLSCVQGFFTNIIGSNPDEPFKEINSDWGETKLLTIKNNCEIPMSITIESALMDDGACNNTAVSDGASCSTIITGKNKTFSLSDPFSDVLGVFPIYVKAKPNFVSRKYALTDTLLVHLSNSSGCFAISKDTFDFTKQNDSKDFVVNDALCQYVSFGDYYIPKATLKLVGADVNTNNPKYNYIDFNYSLNLTGGAYTTQRTIVPRTASVILTKDIQSLPSELTSDVNMRRYSLKFTIPDYGGSGNGRLFFKWMDVNSDVMYGAKIDGPIVVKYQDALDQLVMPALNFDLNNPTACTQGTQRCMTSGLPSLSCIALDHSIWFGDNPPHCLLGREIDPQVLDMFPSQDVLNGLINYITYPPGKVSEIDINFVAHKDSANLQVRAMAYIDYNEEIQTSVPAAGQTIEQIGGGSFRLYPLEGTTFILKSLDANFSTNVISALEICRKALQQRMIDSARVDLASMAVCGTLGITCSAAGDCNFPGTLAINSSVSESLTTSRSPFIELSLTGARAGNALLNNSAIAVWIEGKYIKARFLGEDYAGYNDGNIELTLVDKSIVGNTYGKITTVDYVRRRGS
ncbi:Carboxypeptidase regulatory-like domain protein [uncultured archaeon]|nr:Carboxypeptidase regulatory-like domain protein [uncultured archaeon]